MIKFKELDFPVEDVYFTSDTHYHHLNISKDSVWDRTSGTETRPWSVSEMNDIIVNEINNKVPWNGLLIHMGDWSFGGKDKIEEFRKQIFCENIILCIGNHDHHLHEYKNLFMNIDHIHYIRIGKHNIQCCHYPILSWHQQNKGSWMLHGHCHGHLVDNPNLKLLDVGFDTKIHGHEQYTVYSFLEIEKIMDTKLNISVDHH